MTASHIHFGGGSPNMLTPDEFSTVIARLLQRFRLTENAEISIEIEPHTTTDAFIDSCVEAGVTRFSLGIQGLSPAVQKAANRIRPFYTTSRFASRAKDHDATDINVNLMYRLPAQTAENFLDTIDKTLTLMPTWIAPFGYAHAPWMKTHMLLIGDKALPNAESRWKQAKSAESQLTARGYVTVGMDHFARPDTPLATAAVKTLRRIF